MQSKFKLIENAINLLEEGNILLNISKISILY